MVTITCLEVVFERKPAPAVLTEVTLPLFCVNMNASDRNNIEIWVGITKPFLLRVGRCHHRSSPHIPGDDRVCFVVVLLSDQEGADLVGDAMYSCCLVFALLVFNSSAIT